MRKNIVIILSFLILSLCYSYQSWAPIVFHSGSSAIKDNSITESKLKVVDSPNDEECLTYEVTGGDFEWQSCGVGGSGDNVFIDSSAVVDPDFVSSGDIDFINSANTITANINTGVIVSGDLNTDEVASDNDILTFDAVGSNFSWQTPAELITAGSELSWSGTTLNGTPHTVDTSASTSCAGLTTYLNGEGGCVDIDLVYQPLEATLTDIADGVINEDLDNSANPWLDNEVSDNITINEATKALALSANGSNCVAGSAPLGVDASGNAESCTDYEEDLANSAGLAGAISDETGSGSVVFSTSPTITSPTISTSINLPANAIDTATEISNDLITNAQIADSVQSDTKCIWIENPTAADDFKSIWANKTNNDFLLTELWGESDQTVSFDLQIDDGTPADVNGTDLVPAAGEAEDTTLSGDTTLAAGEELDLVITSVSGTPTWVSICWTGNWVD